MPNPTSPQRRARRRALKRVTYPDRVIGFWKDALRERLAATRKLAGFPVSRGDCHCHSTYSDGIGSVTELAEWQAKAGLDFLFVTDHATVRQKVECVRHPNLWWGQEPGAQHHHLGILGLDRKYTPGPDLAVDYRRVIELGGFPFIPHPTGWYPTTRYSAEQIEALAVLGEEFTIEVINGANNIFDCWDVTDEMSVALWDRHLGLGKVVRGMGNSDAHLPQAIGDVWNGVLAENPTRTEVIEALWAGRFFASDGPFVNLRSGATPMGGILHRRAGATVLFQYECVDSLGLQQIRVIADGRVLLDERPTDRPVQRGTVRFRFPGGRSYLRLECYARDNRRAYSNPVYLRER